MDERFESQVDVLVRSIRSHAVAIDDEAKRLRRKDSKVEFDSTSAESWCLSVVEDALIRARLLVEQNFQVIETLGLVAVSRYLLELSIWLKLFEKDQRYGLLYYGQLIETKRNYYQSTLRQMQREVEMLLDFEKREKRLASEHLSDEDSLDDRARVRREVADSIDKEAARKFSIYASEAKINGYGFQAHLVENNAMPEAMTALAEMAAEQDNFDTNVRSNIADLVTDGNGKKRRWKWNQMAEEVGMEHEYDYIYAFSSKLLHATPVSITTDYKNLEPDEFLIFLKYVEVKLADMVGMARNYKSGMA